MQVILLERHKKLGDVGSLANVKNGFARNYLLPNKKAMQATKENIAIFELRAESIRKEVATKQIHANKLKDKINNKWAYILKQAGEDGRLYGSVNSSELVQVIDEQLKEKLNRNNIQLLKPIKTMGSHDIAVNIFADIFAKVNIMVARTKEEAELQIKAELEPKASNLFKEAKPEEQEIESPITTEESSDDDSLEDIEEDIESEE